MKRTLRIEAADAGAKGVTRERADRHGVAAVGVKVGGYADDRGLVLDVRPDGEWTLYTTGPFTRTGRAVIGGTIAERDEPAVTVTRFSPTPQPHLGGHPGSTDYRAPGAFDAAFTNPVTDEPYPIPDDLRRAAERVIVAYGIGGLCDPMYVANVIAKELGRGDGESTFYPTNNQEQNR